MAEIKLKAPAKIKANPSELALYTFTIGQTAYVNKSAVETQLILKSHITSLKIRLEGSKTWHQGLLEIRKDSHGLVTASDFFAGAKMPSLDIWTPITSQIATLKALNTPQNIQGVLIMLRYTLQEYDKAYRSLTAYAEKNGRGYDGAIERLTFVKSGAEMAVGAYNPYIGGLYSGSLKLLTQGLEVRYNMRDKIDWWGIGINFVIDELFSLAAESVAKRIIDSLKLPAVQQSLPFTIRDKIQNLMRLAPNEIKRRVITAISNKAGSLLGEALKNTIRRHFNTPTELTWEKLSETIAEQFFSKQMSKDVLGEILTGAMDNFR